MGPSQGEVAAPPQGVGPPLDFSLPLPLSRLTFPHLLFSSPLLLSLTCCFPHHTPPAYPEGKENLKRGSFWPGHMGALGLHLLETVDGHVLDEEGEGVLAWQWW